MAKLRYKRTNSTAKIGVDYLQAIVHKHNCIFQEIDTKNDLGIDAIIEIIKDESPTSNFFASQIKSGKTYFNKKTNLCKIPVKNHYDYWTKHPLPVYGIVYIPDLGCAYWVNIKKYLKINPSDTIIKYERTLANQINEATFFSIFIPQILKEVPDISFELASEFFKSDKSDEFFLGLHTLYKKYADKNETWKFFIEYFRNAEIEKVPTFLIYILAHLPWHPDISYFNGTMTNDSQKYGKDLIYLFGKNEILKLLEFIDEENTIARGALGQSVEAIISIVNDFKLILKEIMFDDKNESHIRQYAALIYAYHLGKSSIDDLKLVVNEDTWLIPELIEHIENYGEFNPYA